MIARSAYACVVVEDLLADACADAKLFAKLARQARRMIFAGLALAAGKLPQPFEVDAALAPRDQKRVVRFDDGCGDDDPRHFAAGSNGNARQLLAIGHTRHFGLRATQTMAPKSISAWLKSKT